MRNLRALSPIILIMIGFALLVASMAGCAPNESLLDRPKRQDDFIGRTEAITDGLQDVKQTNELQRLEIARNERLILALEKEIKKQRQADERQARYDEAARKGHTYWEPSAPLAPVANE